MYWYLFGTCIIAQLLVDIDTLGETYRWNYMIIWQMNLKTEITLQQCASQISEL